MTAVIQKSQNNLLPPKTFSGNSAGALDLSGGLKKSVSCPAIMEHVTSVEKNEGAAPILFDKYVFRRDQLIPKELDLRGAICIESDSKHASFLHVLMFIVQKIHQFFSLIFGWTEKKIDPNLCHGSIVVDRVKNEKGEYEGNDFVENHALLESGVKTTTTHYQRQRNIQEVIFYVPRDQKVRQDLINYSKQTCYSDFGDYGHKEPQRANPFSKKDLILCSFHAPGKPNKTTMQRTARAVADLMRGDVFFNDKGDQLRSFFCIPYVTTLLSATHLLSALNEEQKDELRYADHETHRLRSRDELAATIYGMMTDRTTPIGKTFWENPLNQVDTRFLGTGYVSELLDRSVSKTHDLRKDKSIPIISSPIPTSIPR